MGNMKERIERDFGLIRQIDDKQAQVFGAGSSIARKIVEAHLAELESEWQRERHQRWLATVDARVYESGDEDT